jgi:hypothetical protein
MRSGNSQMFFYTCIFAASMVLVLFLARPIFWFISFLGYYWYIFFPGFLIFSFVFQNFNKTRSYRKYYLNINNEDNQNSYFKNTNRTHIENGKLTKAYIRWLMKHVPKSNYINKDDNLNEVLAAVFSVVVLIFVFFLVLSWMQGIPLL